MVLHRLLGEDLQNIQYFENVLFLEFRFPILDGRVFHLDKAALCENLHKLLRNSPKLSLRLMHSQVCEGKVAGMFNTVAPVSLLKLGRVAYY